MNACKIWLFACALGAGFLAFGVDYAYTVGTEGQTMAVGDIPADATTVTKTGPGVLTFTGDNGAFAGKFIVEAGTVKARANAFAAGSSVEVKAGATWDMAGGGSTWAASSPAAFTVSGTGDAANGYDAAFVRSSGTAIRNGNGTFTLAADATIKAGVDHNFGSVSLAGHKLTKKGSAKWDAYGGVTITTGGDTGAIDILAGSIQMQDGKPFDGGNEKNVLTLGAGTSFRQYPYNWNGPKIPWKLNVAGDATLCTCGSGATPVNGNLPQWTGPVELTGGNLAVTSENVANQFRITGAITSTGDYGLVGASPGTAEIYGPVTIAGTIVNTPRSAKTPATMIFTNTVAQSGSGVNYNDFGLLRFTGCPKVEITGPFGTANDKFDMGITGRTEVVDVKYFKHGGATYLSGSLQMPQTLVVSNSTWDGINTDMAIGNNFSKGRVFLYDSVFTNNVRLGNSQWEQWGGGMGAVYQHRGEAYVGNFAYHAFSLGRASTKTASYGYYLNDGGKFTEKANGAHIGPQGLGVFEMTGGTATGSGNWEIAVGPGTGVYLQTGGTNEIYGMKLGKADGAGHGLVAIEGAGTCLRMRGNGGALSMEANNTAGAPFNLVVNDGATLALNAAGMKRNAAVAEGATTKWYCSFDGGVLCPGWFGDFAGSGATAPDRTIIGAHGIVIDTGRDGGDETREKAARYGQPFECPTGKIVTAISLPTDERFLGADGSLYLGPMDVTISGKGVGAAAVAVFDENTRRITGIRVVAGGTGYDENTTATLMSADMSVQYDCAVTVADAPTTGAGFVKRGAHAFQLDNANTYKGPTTVEEGTLYLDTVESLPEGSALVVSNAATLDLHSNSFTVPSLAGSGTVKNGTLVTSALNLAVVPGETLTVAEGSALHLADGATVALTVDLSTLDKEQKYALVSGDIVCDGTVTLPELEDQWRLFIKSSGITLKQDKPLTIILR